MRPSLERLTVDRDLVRQVAGVSSVALRQRDAVVVTEQMVVAGRLLDDDLDVVETRPELLRKRLNRVPDKTLELLRTAETRANGFAPRPAGPFPRNVSRSP